MLHRERLYKVAEQLKKDLISDEKSFTITGLRGYMDEVLDHCINPQSGVGYYLKALYEKWFIEHQQNPNQYPWIPNTKSRDHQFENYRKGTEKNYPRAKRSYYGALFYRNLWDPW